MSAGGVSATGGVLPVLVDTPSIPTTETQSKHKPTARIATSKSVSKKFMYKTKIPTPRFGIFDRENIAIDYAGEFEVEDCLKLTVANVDSDSPKIRDITPGYWSIDKSVALALTVLTGGAFAYLYIKEKKNKSK